MAQLLTCSICAGTRVKLLIHIKKKKEKENRMVLLQPMPPRCLSMFLLFRLACAVYEYFNFGDFF